MEPRTSVCGSLQSLEIVVFLDNGVDGSGDAKSSGVTLRLFVGWSLALFVAGCVRPQSARRPAPHDGASLCDPDIVPTGTLSPGGTPEVAVDEFARTRCAVRAIDVRARHELEQTGVVEGSEHIPMEHVLNRATGWDRDEPIVLVCRSGRRSGTIARELTQMGFTQVWSLTGGVLGWAKSGRELVEYEHSQEPRLPSARRHELTPADVRTHIVDRDQVRTTKVARLLLHGTQACVDGRDAHAVIGTPGGDAGELVLALATAETFRRAPFSTAEVDGVFVDYLDAFGHFYMHTDAHAAARWLADARVEFEDTEQAEVLVREPPNAARARLLETVAKPEHVGCGHLRLSLQFSTAYGVRPGLVRDVMASFFARLWEGDERLEFTVLEGEHAESAVLKIGTGRAVHAYSTVPLVSPRVRDTEVFVVHPEVSSFVRTQNTSFLLEEVPSLTSSSVDEAAFLETLEMLAARQGAQTLARLAADLPTFTVNVHGDEIAVRLQPNLTRTSSR